MTTSAPGAYTAICERVGKWWEITVPELDEVTQARRLEDVPVTVADLVALMTDADPGTVLVNVQLREGPNSATAQAEPVPEDRILALIEETWGSLEEAPEHIRGFSQDEQWDEDFRYDTIRRYIATDPAQQFLDPAQQFLARRKRRA